MRIAGARRAAVGVLPVLALALSVLAAPQALAATTDETRGEADSAPEARSLLLCTAPWPPFVVTVPPLRPPWPKPDPIALGFEVPVPVESSDADQTASASPESAATAATDSSEPVVLPPPLPEALEEHGAESQTPPTAPVIPSLNVEVIPPDPPLDKRLGRVLVAEAMAWRRLQASVVAPEDHAESQAGSEAQANAASDPDPDQEQDPNPAAMTEATPDDDAMAHGAAPLPTLDRLDMPTARALLPRGRAGGPASDIVMAACRGAGLPCRVALVPWLRPGSQVVNGPCDGIFPLEDIAAYRGQLRFSDPLLTSRLAFFTLNTDVRALSDMSEFVVLTQGPSDIAEGARAVVKGLDRAALVQGPDMDTLIRRLVALQPTDRVALYGNYHAILTEMEAITDSPMPGLTVIPHRPQVFRAAFARARVDRDVVSAFNDALRELAESGDAMDLLGADALGAAD